MRRARGCLAAWALACGAAFAQDPSLRLEPQVERIAKLHAQVGQGVLPERSRRALADALREFDATLRRAAGHATGADTRDHYLLLALLWRDYRAWAAKPATRENARGLEERREEIAWVAARGARTLQGRGRSGSGLAALEATEAATGAQRLARESLLRHWRVGDVRPDAERALSAARLREAIRRLRALPYNTPRIATELEVAEGQVGFLLDAARSLDTGRGAAAQQMEFIAKAADHIHETLERAARQYEGLEP